MTQTVSPDKLVNAVVEEFFKNLDNLFLPKTQPEAEGDSGTDEPEETEAAAEPTVDLFAEAVRLLKKAEEAAHMSVNKPEHLVRISDRYITLAELAERHGR